MSKQCRTVQVKICGISEPEHALLALEEGADMIGLAFATSPRRVSIEQAQTISKAVREADPKRKLHIGGLFVNESVEHMNDIAREVGLDRIQLSGDEDARIVNRLHAPAIGSIRADGNDRESADRRMQDWASVTPWAVHVDAHVPGIYGGTGTVGDWTTAAKFASKVRLILAGGLTPDNVADAIHKVKPFAVDVSSGVETNGRKDPEKIRAFIRTAKSTTFDEPESAYTRSIGKQA